MARPLEEYCVSEDATMRDAITVIQRNASRCAVVRAAAGKVIGVFSEGDVLRALLRGSDIHAPLRNLLRPSFIYLRERNLEEAREHIRRGLSLVPVVDAEFRLQDVLTLQDVL
jgi:CBS domain-containing protein